MNQNIAIIGGNVVRKPELRHYNDNAVTNITLAVSVGYGEKEKTHFIPISVWGKGAENSAQYLDKGQQCLIEAQVTTRKRMITQEMVGKEINELVLTARPGGVQFGRKSQSSTNTQTQTQNATQSQTEHPQAGFEAEMAF